MRLEILDNNYLFFLVNRSNKVEWKCVLCINKNKRSLNEQQNRMSSYLPITLFCCAFLTFGGGLAGCIVWAVNNVDPDAYLDAKWYI